MKKLIIVTILILSVFFRANPADLIGAGATFPYPLYSKMFSEYKKQYGIKVNYQAIGSGGGVRQIREKTVDFGASDAFLSDEEMKMFSDEVVHIPICAGAVVITYNLPGNPELKLSQDVIADIFLGKITKWNDPKIQKLNPEVKLPNLKVLVVHRSDGSGTTYIFSDYLSKISKEWKKKVGAGKSLRWPVGVGAKGNSGVTGMIKQIPGTIGYVEFAYALQNRLPIALIKNKSGKFIKPSIETVKLAAETKLPDDMRVSLTDTDAPEGYPITGFTWLIVYKELKNGGLTYEKAKELINLLWWMVHDGQKYTVNLHYAPLSDLAQKKAEIILRSITYEGKKLLD